ncbi:Fungal specific transcription factor domain [Ceratobasidium sp. AG-Ba]|nr:Fungal specific transcription factor domain [Ceratobasidium sp. AG-Ba]
MAKPNDRSKSGCVSCKNRRKKCDETRPTCERCRRAGIACLGYSYLGNLVRRPRNLKNRNPPALAQSPVLDQPRQPANGFPIRGLDSIATVTYNSIDNNPSALERQLLEDLRAARHDFVAIAGSADLSHNFTLPLDPLNPTQFNAQAEGPVYSDPGPSTRLRSMHETLGDMSVRDLDASSFTYTTSGSSLFPRLPEDYGTSIPRPRFHRRALLNSAVSEAGPANGSGCNSCQSTHLLIEANQEPEITDEDEDPEGVMEIISPALALDRGVPSNSLPYILSSSLRWMTQALFEPMVIAYLVKDFLIQRCAMSDDLRHTTLLGATVADLVVKNPKAVLGDFPEITALEHHLNGKLLLAKSRLEVQPELYGFDSLGLLCDMYEMMMIRALSCSMLFHVKTLDQIVPVYRLATGTPPGTVLDLQSQIYHPHPAYRHTSTMDIMLSLTTCRPMIFRYDAATIYEAESNDRIGLQWKSGLPDEFLFLLGQMNMLRQDCALAIDSATIHNLQLQIDNFQPVLNRRSDSYLYIERLMVQECWRQFMYIYLYMGLCGANSHDARVAKAVRKFIMVLEQVKPGRTPDSFLVTPMSLAGIAAHKKRHRDVIRGRLRGLYEYSQPGTYVNDASRIMEEIWSIADIQGRPAVWSDLQYACFTVTGIV